MVSKTDGSDNFCFYRQIASDKLNVIWEITSQCNLQCKHCFRLVSGADLSKIDKLAIVSRFDSEIVGRVLITGGEPLLTIGILEVVGNIQKKSIPVKIVTNLSFSKDIIQSLIEETRGVEISTSVDGHIDELHDSVRGRGSFSLLKENLTALKNSDIKISAICVITKKNIAYVEDIARFCLEQGIKTITFSKLMEDESSGQCVDFFSSSKPHKADEDAFLSDLQSMRNHLLGINIRTVGFVSGKCVVAGKCIIFISHQGNVHPCSMMRNGKAPISILDASICEIIAKIENEPMESFSCSCPSLV